MKKHSNQQTPFQGQANPPVPAQEHMFLASQNMLQASMRGGVMLDPSLLNLAKIQPAFNGSTLDARPLATSNSNGLSTNVMLQQQMAAALLTQSMDSAGEVSNSQGSDDLMFGASNMAVNKLLMNMNIPAANFTKALNFQTLADHAFHQGVEDDEQNEDYEDVDEAQRLEEGDIDSETLEDEESLTQHSFDASGDLLEQQQSQQQAMLMSKFRQLREWQQRQQELLMVEQQNQLDLLREEQERVQRMIAKQREMQWGSQPASVNGFTNTGSQMAQFSSPRATPSRNIKTLPQPYAQGLGAQATLQQNLQPPRNVSSQISPTSATMPNGRPVPLFPEQRMLWQNPAGAPIDVESDLGSQNSLVEDGVYPLTDQESEDAAIKQDIERPHFQPSKPSTKQSAIVNQKQAYQKQSVMLGKVSNTQMAHNQNTMENSCSDRLSLADHDHLSLSQIGSEGNQIVGDANRGYRPPSTKNSSTDFNHNHDTLDFREGTNVMGKNEESNAKFSPRSTEEFYHESEGDFYNHRPDYQEESEQSEDEDDEEEYEENEDECECDHMETHFDEIPVSGIGATKKTFEELLEEELRKEEERMIQQNQQPSGNSSGSKKQFLKKGKGVARFTASGAREHRKSKRRTKSTERGQTGMVTQKPPPANVGSGGRNSAPGSRPTSAGSRTNSTPLTRGLPPKGPTVNRKIIASSTEPSSKQQTQLAKQQTKTSSQKQYQKGKPSMQSIKILSQNQQGEQKPIPLLELNKLSAPKAVEPPKTGNNLTPLNGKDPCDTPSKYSDTDSLGETSFQARLTARAAEEVVEVEQLEEFEILEQFADDNVSFMSNMSAVNHALQQNKGTKNHRMPPISSIIKPPSRPQVPGPAVTPAPHEEDSSSSESEDEDDDTSVSSDFDTCPSNQREVVYKERNSIMNKSCEEHDDTLVESPGQEQSKFTPQVMMTQAESLVKPMQRKVATMDSSRRSLLASVHQFSDSEAEMNKNLSDLSEDDTSQSESISCQYETSGHQTEKASTVKDNVQAGSKLISPETLMYKTGHSQSQKDETNNNNEYTDIKQSVNEESQSGNRIDNKKDLFTQQIAFDDDTEAWDDSHCEDSVGGSATNSGERNDSKPIVRRSILSRNNGAGDSTEKTTPPTSQLVSKLFPKLRQEKPKPKVEPEAMQRLATATLHDASDGVQSKLLRDKLAELEQEIEKFRSENSKLVTLRKEREEGLVQLRKEMSEFEKQKNDELKRLQEFKAEETKKLKREKKQFEQYQQAARAMPNKKEREEIEMLKSQLSELQDEMKRKESRWTASMTRLREKCESLTAENTELKDEIKLLERQRLQSLQKQEAAPKLKEEVSRPPPVKKSTMQPTKSPKPESQSDRLGPHDSALSTSTNLDLDESDLKASAEPPHPRGMSGASPRQPEMSFTPTPLVHHVGPPLSPPVDPSFPHGAKKPMPRKKATPQSLANTIDKGNEQYEEISHTDGKVEKIYSNGAREILFTNGTRKQVSANGESIIVSFFNGDMKQILPDQRVVYFYADAQTTHTTYPDGLEILQFPNQQMEKHYPDGTKEITFPDQTIKYLFPSGIEESIYPDGTVIRVEKNGEKTVEFPNGQREVHTEHYKRREYPDGTVKTVFPDGKQETRYSSGRVRVKDKEGNVIVDKRL